MRWNIQNKLDSNTKNSIEQIQKVLLENRGLKTKKQIENFLNPQNPTDINPSEVGIKNQDLKKSIARIKKSIKNQEEIIIFGDYDADGITATAILWETLHHLGANVMPFIPHREKHGYGLSIEAIDDLLIKSNPKLIITVDNGIVAHHAADHINNLDIDLIITDHHVASDKNPQALAIIQTTKLAGAGVAWIFAKELIKKFKTKNLSPLNTLDLATIGTVADQVPLTDFNRSIVKYGLKTLSKTKRAGLQELYKQAQLESEKIESYHINFIIAPRINAMGRLAHGMDSLRLLCTNNKNRARKLSKKLNNTNQDRKDLTFKLVNMAQEIVTDSNDNIIIISHTDFHEGVIGLVAGKLTESHHRPSIVIGKDKQVSKASARSVKGVNIIELIRRVDHHLINAGGHPMAAGFSINTDKIDEFKEEITSISNQEIDKKLLTPELTIETQIKLSDVSWELLEVISKFEPFGMGNRKPIFSISKVKILEKYKIGKQKNHLKLIIPSQTKDQTKIEALWFGHGKDEDRISQTANLAFYVDKNTWNNITSLQLILKDIKN